MQADALASLDWTSEPSSRRIAPVGYVEKPSIKLESTITAAVDIDEWRMTIITYLRDGTLLEDKFEAHKIRTKATRFSLVDGILY